MYENATHLQFQPYALDEGLQILRSRVVPILKGQSGLLSLALVPNRITHQVTILSMWTSSACARIVEIRPEYRQVIQLLDSLLVHQARPSAQTRSLAEAPVGPVGDWSMN